MNGRDIKIENVKYKVYKNTKHTLVSNNININNENGVPFVGCGVETGAILGVVYKAGNSSITYSNQASTGLVVVPFISICTTTSQANKMYENYKKDKSRFNKLASEIQKQKIIDKARISQIINEEQSVSQTMSNSKSEATLERGKRLSLNNGIFKPNDNY